jgi:hypothetical protein
MKAKTGLLVVSAVALVLCLALPVLAADVAWTKVDGTDFAGSDIWFTEMFGATNGFPLENQTVGDDPVVGRALTLNKDSTAGRAVGRNLAGAQNAGLYKIEFDVKLPSNLGAATRAAAVAFFDTTVSTGTNIRRPVEGHVFRIFSADPAEGVAGNLYLDFKKNIANVPDAKDDAWQVADVNLEGAIAVTEIDPKFTADLWIKVSAVLNYTAKKAEVTLTLLEGPDTGYSRTFTADLPGVDKGLGLMSVAGITKGGGSSWTTQIANISIYTGK